MDPGGGYRRTWPPGLNPIPAKAAGFYHDSHDHINNQE